MFIECADERIAADQNRQADHRERARATIAAYFEFIDSKSEAFRLVFESDLRSDPEVRDLVDTVSAGCAAAIASTIREDTHLPDDEAELLGVALAGMAHITARYWLDSGRTVPREVADSLVAQLAWRGVRGFPKADLPEPTTHDPPDHP